MAACGLTGIGGIGRALAQEGTVACQVSSISGTLQNGEPNYWATATRAEFVFLTRMRAVGDSIVLYSEEQGGEVIEGTAAVKGILVREGDGPLQVDRLQFVWPITAHKQDGQLYGIVQMAHEQNVPVGLALAGGGNPLGEILFEKGVFDPTQPVVGFDVETSKAIHNALMKNEGFSARLMIGGAVYSTIEPDTARYVAFVNDKLLAAMDEARRQDAEAPCTYVNPEEYLEGIENCFLTSACCTVLGLGDDCWELATLRRFRDGYMQGFAQGRADVARYYAEAPAIAQALVSSAAGRRRLLRLYWRTIVPAVLLARLGCNRAAHAIYRRMMLELLPAG